MKSFLKTAFAALLILSGTTTVLRADEPMSQSDAEKISIMLEFNNRMVSLIENYLKERERIPDAYRPVTDKAFLDKAKAEKPMKSMDSRALKRMSRSVDSTPAQLEAHADNADALGTSDALGELKSRSRNRYR